MVRSVFPSFPLLQGQGLIVIVAELSCHGWLLTMPAEVKIISAIQFKQNTTFKTAQTKPMDGPSNSSIADTTLGN